MGKINNNFKEKLKELRERSGMTQEQLAELMRLSKSTISQYENQERAPSPHILVKIASVFHVSTDYLLGVDEIRRAELSGLTDEDIEIVERLIENMREKNRKIKNFDRQPEGVSVFVVKKIILIKVIVKDEHMFYNVSCRT